VVRTQLQRGAAERAAVVRLNRDTGHREFAQMRWGWFPSGKDPKFGYSTINARAEEVATKPAYREALKKRRCLVPADAFYEWRRIDKKTSTRSRLPSRVASLMPCRLWERWQPKEGEPLEISPS